MYVACLPAPPDHRADLGEEDKAITIPLLVRSTLEVTRSQSRTTQRQAEAGESRKQIGLMRVRWPSVHSQVSL